MLVEAVLLGAAQDGGVPQAGCYCQTCRLARESPAERRYVCSLGILDREHKAFWLVDATPNFGEQLHLLQTLARESSLQGIFITHAHMGHYTGLVHLGREAMNARLLPVYGTPALGSFLAANAPWAQLVQTGNIAWKPVQPGVPVTLIPGLSLVPIAVPHRGEYSDTLGYLVRGPGRALFYCPDVDRWEDCEFDFREFIAGVDFALLDGTFFDAGELPDRDMRQVPHPLVRESVELLRGVPAQVRFVHLNHTNPLWHDGAARAWLEESGFAVGEQGEGWVL